MRENWIRGGRVFKNLKEKRKVEKVRDEKEEDEKVVVEVSESE